MNVQDLDYSIQSFFFSIYGQFPRAELERTVQKNLIVL